MHAPIRENAPAFAHQALQVRKRYVLHDTMAEDQVNRAIRECRVRGVCWRHVDHVQAVQKILAGPQTAQSLEPIRNTFGGNSEQFGTSH